MDQDRFNTGVQIEKVSAVVVTYNRKALLQECLEALRGQTYPLNRIIIVDNASTDGTPEFLHQAGYLSESQIEYLRLEQNLGGAGGFHHGFRRAYETGAEWIWAMDDDTIAQPSALERLLLARARFDEANRPDLLSSAVLWSDGTAHPMNLPPAKMTETRLAEVAAAHGVRSIRAATFVATLFHRRVIEQFGLPLLDYFIWCDDIEYTARVLRWNFGVLVPDSLAVHKTARKHNPVDAEPQRFYYHVRNTLWMLLRSSAWTLQEKCGMVLPLFLTIGAYLRRSGFDQAKVDAVVTGIWDGIWRKPVR